MKLPPEIKTEAFLAGCRENAVFCAAHAQSAEKKAGDREDESEILSHLDAAINAAHNVLQYAKSARQRYGLEKP